jgi:DNA-binding transcriptional LysR family regulator
MNWEDFRYMLSVARTGTLSEAAQELRVSVSTVSRRITVLEDDVGTALFEKKTRGAVLTTAGEEMLAVAEAMQSLTHDLDARIHGLDTRLEGEIRATSLYSLWKLWAKDLRDFQRHFQAIELQLMSGFSVANMTEREADVAVRVAKTAPEHLIGRRHAEVAYAIYGTPDLVNEYGEKTPYSDYPWISWDFSVARGVDIWLAENAPGAKIAARAERMPVMVECAKAGWGLTMLPCFTGDVIPELRRVGPYLELSGWIWVLSHPAMRGSARIRKFVGFMTELLARDRDLIEGRRPA